MTDQVPLLLTVPFVMIRNVVIQNRFLARFRSFQQVLIFKYFKYLCPQNIMMPNSYLLNCPLNQGI